MKLPEQYDNYNRPETVFEKPSGKNPVEPGASLPVRVQIEQMIGAGKRLNEFRASQFDFDEGTEVPDDVETDPTRNPEFDLADASQIARVTSENLRKQAESSKVKLKEEVPGTNVDGETASKSKEIK